MDFQDNIQVGELSPMEMAWVAISKPIFGMEIGHVFMDIGID